MKRYVGNASCIECGANGQMIIAANNKGRAKRLAQKYGHYRKDQETKEYIDCDGKLIVIHLHEAGEFTHELYTECVTSFSYDL